MDNFAIARELQQRARALTAAGENLYRVRAYRRAAAAVMALDRPAGELALLGAIPGVGPSLQGTVAEIAGLAVAGAVRRASRGERLSA